MALARKFSRSLSTSCSGAAAVRGGAAAPLPELFLLVTGGAPDEGLVTLVAKMVSPAIALAKGAEEEVLIIIVGPDPAAVVDSSCPELGGRHKEADLRSGGASTLSPGNRITVAASFVGGNIDKACCGGSVKFQKALLLDVSACAAAPKPRP